MEENKKEESFKDIKTRLREELNDLYNRYGLDLVKLVVDEDDLHEALKKLQKLIKIKWRLNASIYFFFVLF